MSRKHLIIGAVLIVCAFVAQAAAQKNELAGALGRTFISNQGILGAPSFDPYLRFGNGLTFEIDMLGVWWTDPFGLWVPRCHL